MKPIYYYLGFLLKTRLYFHLLTILLILFNHFQLFIHSSCMVIPNNCGAAFIQQFYSMFDCGRPNLHKGSFKMIRIYFELL